MQEIVILLIHVHSKSLDAILIRLNAISVCRLDMCLPMIHSSLNHELLLLLLKERHFQMKL